MEAPKMGKSADEIREEQLLAEAAELRKTLKEATEMARKLSGETVEATPPSTPTPESAPTRLSPFNSSEPLILDPSSSRPNREPLIISNTPETNDAPKIIIPSTFSEKRTEDTPISTSPRTRESGASGRIVTAEEQADLQSKMVSPKKNPAQTETSTTTPAPAEAVTATAPKEKVKKEIAPKNPKEEAEKLIAELDLKEILPAEFEGLNDAQKLKVLRDIKQRIVDIVKSDAQTKYSEDLIKKLDANSTPTSGKISTLFKNIKTSIGSAVTKERDLTNLEAKAFKELKNTKAGKELIKQDLEILTEKVVGREMYVSKNGLPCFEFIPDGNNEKIQDFNHKANYFAYLPYEWGQEKSGSNKKKYEKAKAEYEQARAEVLKIKNEADGRESAMIEISEIDNVVKMEQLLNTHPEFEKALIGFSKTAKGMEWGRNAQKFFTSSSTSKENVGIGVGGAGVRWGVRAGLGFTSFLASGMFVAAPVIGGATGWYRGKIRGGKTLLERQKGARKGKEDETKEAMNTVSAENLTERLETLMKALEEGPENWKIKTFNTGAVGRDNNRLDQIKRRIAYTQGKIEGGLVNFGDARTTLEKQYQLMDALNRALVLSASMETTTRKDIDKRLDQFLEYKSENINEAQKSFIRKQAMRGALMGAGAASIGYALRYLWEHVHHVDVGEHPKAGASTDKTEAARKLAQEQKERLAHENAQRQAQEQADEARRLSNEQSNEAIRLAEEEKARMAPEQLPQAPTEHAEEAKDLTDEALREKRRLVEEEARRLAQPDEGRANPREIDSESDRPTLRRTPNRRPEIIEQPERIIRQAPVEDSTIPPHKDEVIPRITRYNKPTFDESGRQIYPRIVRDDIADPYLNKPPIENPLPSSTSKIDELKQTIDDRIDRVRTHGQFDQNNTRNAENIPRVGTHESHIPQNNPEFRDNPFKLEPEKLMKTFEIYKNNLGHIYGGEQATEKWNLFKGLKASDVLEKKDYDKTDKMMNYLHRLYDVTKVKPKGGLLSKAETTEQYIARALQKAAQIGQLDKVTIE